MGVVRVLCCDKCESVIRYKDGFVISGNIYTSDSSSEDHIGGGLVGNNFNVDGTLSKSNYFCRDCLLQVLGIQTSNTRC